MGRWVLGNLEDLGERRRRREGLTWKRQSWKQTAKSDTKTPKPLCNACFGISCIFFVEISWQVERVLFVMIANANMHLEHE